MPLPPSNDPVSPPRPSAPPATKPAGNGLIPKKSMMSWKPDESLQKAIDDMFSVSQEDAAKSRVDSTFSR